MKHTSKIYWLIGKEREYMFAQTAAIVIFDAMFVLIVADKIERHIVTLIAGLLTMILVFTVGMHSLDAAIGTLNLDKFFELSFWYS